MKKILSIILVLSILFSFSITASAATTENVDITYRAIKLVLDGEQFIPCDESGKTVEPFIMNSNRTTYLPLRALAQALGLSVKWDSATSTVILSTGGEVKTGSGSYTPSTGSKNVQITYRDIKVTLDGETLQLVNTAGDKVEPFIMNDTTYLPLRTVGEALGLNIGWDSATSTVKLDTPAQNGYWVISKETTQYDDFFSSTTLYEYDANGNNTLQKYSDNSGYTYTSKTSYDANGQWIGEEVSGNDGSYFNVIDKPEHFKYENLVPGVFHDVQEIKYNANGDVIYELWGDKLNGTLSESFYEYDAQGRLAKLSYTEAYSDGEWGYTETYSYSGNVRTNNTVYDDGSPEVSTTTFTYDSQGRILKEVTAYEFGSYTVEYAYDKYGNETLYKWYDSDGNYTELRYEYDAMGNLIFEHTDDNGSIGTYKAEYNADGILIYEEQVSEWGISYVDEYFYDADGRYLGRHYEDEASYLDEKVIYDDEGLIIRFESESGGETAVYTITNDENGLMIKAEGDNGGVHEIYTFEYTFIKQ